MGLSGSALVRGKISRGPSWPASGVVTGAERGLNFDSPRKSGAARRAATECPHRGGWDSDLRRRGCEHERSRHGPHVRRLTGDWSMLPCRQLARPEGTERAGDTSPSESEAVELCGTLSRRSRASACLEPGETGQRTRLKDYAGRPDAGVRFI